MTEWERESVYVCVCLEKRIKLSKLMVGEYETGNWQTISDADYSLRTGSDLIVFLFFLSSI